MHMGELGALKPFSGYRSVHLLYRTSSPHPSTYHFLGMYTSTISPASFCIVTRRQQRVLRRVIVSLLRVLLLAALRVFEENSRAMRAHNCCMRVEMEVHRFRFVSHISVPIQCLSFSSDGTKLALSRSDSNIEVWVYRGGTFVKELWIPGRGNISIESLKWCGSRLFTGSLSGMIKISKVWWDCQIRSR